MKPRLLGILAALTLACSTTDDPEDASLSADEVAPVAETYAQIVAASYTDSRTAAEALELALDALVADPSEATLEAARQAWLDAREPYGQTEVYRFYDGPIDNPDDGPEGQLNAWPMDEAYVDYVDGAPDSGIINDATTYPTIDAALLASLNEAGGETNISTGYHAIEFLLWGQDMNPDGPGARAASDYATDGSSTVDNPERRGAYVLAAAELLISDLSGLEAAWASGYVDEFNSADPQEVVRRILLGMGSLSGAELAGERMNVALETMDQEDEHSCFSDNTHRDIINNARGIENVYLGRYGEVDGPGIYDLVAARDPSLADRLRDELAASVAAAEAIPAPFDRAIVDHREAVQATIDALRLQADTIVEVATLFEINLALE
ncbi:imelysin family protein [Enhygromyxa salina]|nr:imelysin family protein [Enhygromyxa salina]